MDTKFSQLASKVLSKEATEEEKNLFARLLKDNEADASMYNTIKAYWDADVNMDKDLSLSVDERIWSHRKKYRRRDFINYFYRVAAIILLLVTCGVTGYYKMNPSHLYTYAAKESITDYVLPDGTKIKLNKNSSITFSETFGKKDRHVDLTGEAYFEVTKDTVKTFIVSTQGTETKVLGTQFNIQSDEERKQVRVTLVEGRVRFEAGHCKVLMHPREEIIYHLDSGKYEQQVTDLQFNTAWKEGRYYYQDISFGELMKKLEHIYGISIELNDPEIETKKITVSFLTGVPVEEILLSLEKGLKFKVNGTSIIIEKNKKRLT